MNGHPSLNLAGRVRRWAQDIRHAPGLSRLEGLWKVARKPYQTVLGLSLRGVGVQVGGSCAVRMPADFSAGSWETYEIQEVRQVARWVDEHPNGLLLDVGCAVGIYSLIGLFRSLESHVIAFDPDLASLKATQRLCVYAKGRRLRVVHGFVSNQHASGISIDTAAQFTEEQLRASRLTGSPGTTAYRCLEGNTDASIPIHSLDGLWKSTGYPDGPILLKCDVEGAEQLVLEGANQLLQRKSTTLSLSVHPPALPSYGHSVIGIRRVLESAGYRVEVLSVDHEEHWWCEKN